MSEELNIEVPNERATAVAISPHVKQIIEALLFASDEPVTLPMLRVVFDDVNRDVPENEKTTATNEEIRSIIETLNAEYAESNRAYRIQQIAGGYVYSTDKKFATWVGKLFKEKARRKLSQTAVETLAIIAYKQPITKSAVEFIRGVNADYIMKTLLEKNLATIVGRAHSPGRPLLYGTTPDFLKHFGLNEITDLPKPREIEELLGETELEVEKRMLANQQEIEFKGKLEEKLDPNSRAPHIPRKKSKLQEPPGEDAGKTVVEKPTPPRPQAQVEDEVEIKNTIESVTKDEVEIRNESIDESNEIESEGSQQPVIESVDIQPESLDEAPQQLDKSLIRSEIRSDAPTVETAQAAEPLSELPEESLSADNDPLVSSQPEIIRSAQESASAQQTIHSDDTARSFPGAHHAEEHDTQKGWSKWKTKVKTFFRKLFG
jgi:segregation and condensation protein B